MRKSPDDRYQSVLQFRDAVIECQSHDASRVLASAAQIEMNKAVDQVREELGRYTCLKDSPEWDHHRNTIYQTFERSLAMSEKAIELWEDNESARLVKSRVVSSYIDAASRFGDYRLSHAQYMRIFDSDVSSSMSNGIMNQEIDSDYARHTIINCMQAERYLDIQRLEMSRTWRLLFLVMLLVFTGFPVALASCSSVTRNLVVGEICSAFGYKSQAKELFQQAEDKIQENLGLLKDGQKLNVIDAVNAIIRIAVFHLQGGNAERAEQTLVSFGKRLSSSREALQEQNLAQNARLVNALSRGGDRVEKAEIRKQELTLYLDGRAYRRVEFSPISNSEPCNMILSTLITLIGFSAILIAWLGFTLASYIRCDNWLRARGPRYPPWTIQLIFVLGALSVLAVCEKLGISSFGSLVSDILSTVVENRIWAGLVFLLMFRSLAKDSRLAGVRKDQRPGLCESESDWVDLDKGPMVSAHDAFRYRFILRSNKIIFPLAAIIFLIFQLNEPNDFMVAWGFLLTIPVIVAQILFETTSKSDIRGLGQAQTSLE